MAQNTEKQIEALTNFLRNAFTKDEKYFIQKVQDGRSKKYAIVERITVEESTFDVTLTRYMKYEEMNSFFMGMRAVKQKLIRID